MQLRRILTLALLLAAAGLHAQPGIRFFTGDWSAARSAAKQGGKYLFVDAYTDWCYWCKVMEKNTFPDPEVGAFVNQHFISMRIDFEKGIGVDLGMKYRVSGYPTILVFRPDGYLAARIIGYNEDNSAFIQQLRDAMDPARQLPAFGDPGKLDPGFPDFYKQSFLTGDKRKWPDADVVAAYLDQQKDLYSETAWAVLARFNAGEKYEKHFLDQLDRYRKLAGAAEVDDKLTSLIGQRISKAAQTKDEAAFRQAMQLASTYLPGEGKAREQSMLGMEMEYYERAGDWKRMGASLDKLVRLSGYENHSQINGIAWTLYKQSDDQDVLAAAAAHMLEVVSITPDYMYLDTYAALLFKTGRTDEADQWAVRAIETGKAAGEDVKDTEALLEQIRGGRR